MAMFGGLTDEDHRFWSESHAERGSLAPLVAMGVALLVGQRGSGGVLVVGVTVVSSGAVRVWAEGGLHQVRREERHLQPPAMRHTCTTVHQHTSKATLLPQRHS